MAKPTSDELDKLAKLFPKSATVTLKTPEGETIEEFDVRAMDVRQLAAIVRVLAPVLQSAESIDMVGLLTKYFELAVPALAIAIRRSPEWLYGLPAEALFQIAEVVYQENERFFVVHIGPLIEAWMASTPMAAVANGDGTTPINTLSSTGTPIPVH